MYWMKNSRNYTAIRTEKFESRQLEKRNIAGKPTEFSVLENDFYLVSLMSLLNVIYRLVRVTLKGLEGLMNTRYTAKRITQSSLINGTFEIRKIILSLSCRHKREIILIIFVTNCWHFIFETSHSVECMNIVRVTVSTWAPVAVFPRDRHVS
jgi:hypothetical protein